MTSAATKATIVVTALVVECVTVAYSTQSLLTTIALMSLLLVPFGFAVSLRSHVGTAVTVAFALSSGWLAANADREGWGPFTHWLRATYYQCLAVALVACLLWVWDRVTRRPAAQDEDLDIVRLLAGEGD